MNKFITKTIDHTPIKIYFTPKNVYHFVQYLKNNINLADYPECNLLIHSLYSFGNTMNVLYNGPMYLGLATNKSIYSFAPHILESEWVPWTKDEVVARQYLSNSTAAYKYLIARKGNAIDPAMVKEYARLALDNYGITEFETYTNNTSKEVIAPFKRSEISSIINIY